MWRESIAPQVSDGELKTLDDRVMVLVPDPRRTPFDMYAANAEYAVLALAYCIGTRRSGDASDVMHCAVQAFNSIHNFLTSRIERTPQLDSNHPQWAEHLTTHPLIRAEVFRQEKDLLDVQGAVPETVAHLIDEIRRRAEIDSHSFLPSDVMRTTQASRHYGD